MKELREMLCPVHKVDTAATNQALIKYNYAHVSILDVSDSINVSNTFLLFISQPGCSIAQCLLLVAQLCPTLCDPMDCSLPGFSVGKRRDSMGSLQVRIVEYQSGLEWKTKVEYWSGLPFPSPRDLLNTRTEPRSPALQADSLSSESPGKQPKQIKTLSISFWFCF